MSEPYIRAANVSKVYKSGTADLVVFAGVNLDVERGVPQCDTATAEAARRR
mgnify:CR=1 FL=1